MAVSPSRAEGTLGSFLCSHPGHPIPIRALCQSPIYRVSPKHTLYCSVLWRQTWFLCARCCHAGLCPHRALPDPGSSVSTPNSSGAGVALSEVLCAGGGFLCTGPGAAATPAGSAGSESQRGWAFFLMSEAIPSHSLLWLSCEKPGKDVTSPAMDSSDWLTRAEPPETPAGPRLP